MLVSNKIEGDKIYCAGLNCANWALREQVAAPFWCDFHNSINTNTAVTTTSDKSEITWLIPTEDF